jgi:hypothetical protein
MYAGYMAHIALLEIRVLQGVFTNTYMYNKPLPLGFFTGFLKGFVVLVKNT